MNRWLLIRRLRGPAFLILFGITALLHQWGILGFGRSWPLYLILAGLLMLAERAALAAESRPQSPQQSYLYYSSTPASPPPMATSRSSVPDPAPSPDPPPPAGDNELSGGNWRA